MNSSKSTPAANKTPASRSLWQKTGQVGAMTFLSRVLGFMRDMVVARVFGAGAGVDAFLVAFKIPNFLRRLFAEGAFSQAFVPVLSQYQSTESPDSIKALIDRVSGNLALLLTAVTVVAVLFAPILVMVFAPGFIEDPFRYNLASQLLRITFPYILLISLTAFAGAILNTYHRFMVPAVTPCLLNLAMIGSAIFLSPYFSEPITALAWGVCIGGVLQLIFQWPFLWRLGLVPRFIVDWKHPGVRRILTIMVPALFGVGVAQINLLIDTIFASFLVSGSVSWLYYSDRLMEFPLGIFGVALATVILPQLARNHALSSTDQFSSTLNWALRNAWLIGLPAGIGLFILSGPMLVTLFNYGEFTQMDVLMSRRSLMAYSFGLVAFILVKVLASGFYAQQDMRTPVRVAVIAMITNIVLNAALVYPLAHAGLALATTLSAFLNAGLLWYFLRRKEIYQTQSNKTIWKILVAGMMMALFLIFFVPLLDEWFSWNTWHRVGQLFLWVAAGAGVYFVSLLLLGARWGDFSQR